MQNLSEYVTELIKQVEAGPGLLGRFFGQSDARPALLDKIGTSKELAAFPYLVRIWLESRELANDCLRAMSRLLATASPDEIIELGGNFRSAWNWVFPNVWRVVQPGNVSRLVRGVGFPATALGVLSWHPNGRVREQAVRELHLIRDGSEVPFLLVRLNDWVEAVRIEARCSVLERLDQGHADWFFGHLYLVLRLMDWHRGDHSEIVMRVIKELTEPKFEAKLIEALNSRSRYVRHACYRLAMATDGRHRLTLVRCCLRSQDPVLRLWASRDARQKLSLDELESAVHVMRQDAFMPVRREAQLTLIERFPDQALASLKEALLESAASMRNFARFHLRKLGFTDSLSIYRESVVARRKLPSAIAGLGEVGSIQDAEILTPFLQSPVASVRASATRAIGGLAGVQYATVLLQMLQDDSKRVSREAQRALMRRMEHIPTQDLWNIFETSTRPHVRWAVLRILEELDTWTTMPYLVGAAADIDVAIAEQARRSILGRMNRVFTTPTQQQRAAIEERLRAMAQQLGSFANECRSWLASRT